ncbi:hypothetical protein [Domibacillus aminovorans]|uniref:Uncharacterized protein n=1 Tax=Domibacillus aminovorans TaxID=29332 RepID=A0A177L479_9BACI|nr:hypothetical protein [Domibacillus aminovorans]OAH60499.1 hypothetical protein AWH49_16705 [Domibacillus aminovorans]
MIGQTFIMRIEKPMSYHERLFRAEGYTTGDIGALVTQMIDKGFIEADDPHAREMACVAEMAKVRARQYRMVEGEAE